MAPQNISAAAAAGVVAHFVPVITSTGTGTGTGTGTSHLCVLLSLAIALDESGVCVSIPLVIN